MVQGAYGQSGRVRQFPDFPKSLIHVITWARRYCLTLREVQAFVSGLAGAGSPVRHVRNSS
jgi:hypothetical protein